MRAVFPILLVILGLGVANYANARLPCGLADADLEDVAQLAREGAIDVLDWAVPEWRESRSHRSIHRQRQVRRHRQRTRTVQTRIIRNSIRVGSEEVSVRFGERPLELQAGEGESARLRGFGQRVHASAMENPIEITFVVPDKNTRDKRRRR